MWRRAAWAAILLVNAGIATLYTGVVGGASRRFWRVIETEAHCFISKEGEVIRIFDKSKNRELESPGFNCIRVSPINCMGQRKLSGPSIWIVRSDGAKSNQWRWHIANLLWQWPKTYIDSAIINRCCASATIFDRDEKTDDSRTFLWWSSIHHKTDYSEKCALALNKSPRLDKSDYGQRTRECGNPPSEAYNAIWMPESPFSKSNERLFLLTAAIMIGFMSLVFLFQPHISSLTAGVAFFSFWAAPIGLFLGLLWIG